MVIKATISVVLMSSLLLFVSASPAASETISLAAHLTGSAEVPPNSAKAHGEARFSYDTQTRQMRYSVTYENLSGAALVVDIHGPADDASTAAVVINFPVPESPISGSARLSTDQSAALIANRLYIDVHTAAYRNGEIRGQIQR